MVDKDIVYSPVLSDLAQGHPQTKWYPLLLQHTHITH